MKGMNIIFIVMLVSLAIAFFWDSMPAVKEAIHIFLDPTAGTILNFDKDIGMIIITAIITLFITIIQKYSVDNNALRELKKKQKALQEEMKGHMNDEKRLMEIRKKQAALLPEMMNLTMRPLLFTSIPIILFFRWFSDYFNSIGTSVRIFGILSWFLAYIIFSLIFSSIFKRVFRLP